MQIYKKILESPKNISKPPALQHPTSTQVRLLSSSSPVPHWRTTGQRCYQYASYMLPGCVECWLSVGLRDWCVLSNVKNLDKWKKSCIIAIDLVIRDYLLCAENKNVKMWHKTAPSPSYMLKPQNTLTYEKADDVRTCDAAGRQFCAPRPRIGLLDPDSGHPGRPLLRGLRKRSALGVLDSARILWNVE